MKHKLDKYREYYKEMLRKGEWFQDFVTVELQKAGINIINYSSKEYQVKYGENLAGFEIKYDMKFKKTGNIYIETHEKAHPEYPNFVESGIYRGNFIYIIGDEEKFYMFKTKDLRKWHRSGMFMAIEKPTSKGFLISEKKADEGCINFYKPNEKQGELFGRKQ